MQWTKASVYFSDCRGSQPNPCSAAVSAANSPDSRSKNEERRSPTRPGLKRSTSAGVGFRSLIFILRSLCRRDACSTIGPPFGWEVRHPGSGTWDPGGRDLRSLIFVLRSPVQAGRPRYNARVFCGAAVSAAILAMVDSGPGVDPPATIPGGKPPGRECRRAACSTKLAGGLRHNNPRGGWA